MQENLDDLPSNVKNDTGKTLIPEKILIFIERRAVTQSFNFRTLQSTNFLDAPSDIMIMKSVEVPQSLRFDGEGKLKTTTRPRTQGMLNRLHAAPRNRKDSDDRPNTIQIH